MKQRKLDPTAAGKAPPRPVRAMQGARDSIRGVVRETPAKAAEIAQHPVKAAEEVFTGAQSEVPSLVEPTVHDDVRVLLADAIMMYLLSELRDVCLQRGNKLPLTLFDKDEEASRTLLQMPLETASVEKIVLDHADELKTLHGERRHDAHLEYLASYHEKLPGNDEEGNPTAGEIVLFDDERSETELVYAIRLDHARKRIVLSFRGSITSQDFIADAKAVPFKVDNPVVKRSDFESADPKVKSRVKPIITLHKGFYDYLFDAEYNKEETAKPRGKYAVIMENLRSLMEQYDDYSLWITGHSLGGALCTLFSFFAASELSKRVTAISFASPKIGNLSFRAALQFLEDSGHLRLLRVANDMDPVTVVPRDPLMLLPPDLVCPLFFLMFTQHKIFRHVGIGLVLYASKSCVFVHANPRPTYCRTLWSDWAKVAARVLVVIMSALCFVLTLGLCAKGYRMNHGYPEYWNRVKDNTTELEKHTLGGLYDELNSNDGEEKSVKLRYW